MGGKLRSSIRISVCFGLLGFFSSVLDFSLFLFSRIYEFSTIYFRGLPLPRFKTGGSEAFLCWTRDMASKEDKATAFNDVSVAIG